MFDATEKYRGIVINRSLRIRKEKGDKFFYTKKETDIIDKTPFDYFIQHCSLSKPPKF
jgi:hypothetical protein